MRPLKFITVMNNPNIKPNVTPLVLPIGVTFCLMFGLFMTVMNFKGRIMPILALEPNEAKDKMQLRVYYALKGNYGADGKYNVFGRDGYCVDRRDHESLPAISACGETSRAMDAFKNVKDYEATTPESLRYMCEHSASSEAYRRQATRLAKDVISYMAVLGIVGLMVFMTYTIGSSILAPPS